MTITTTSRFPVIALVSSAGGLDALSRVLAPLPADLPAAVIALQHTSPDHQSHLAAVLDRRTALPVSPAVDGDPLLPGRVLVIPAAKHLLVGTDERLRLLDTGDLPPARPSADLLLVSLAVALTDRVVAVVLTGRGHDASVGVQAVHAYGGTVMVQDQDSAEQPGMPTAAADADHAGTPLHPNAIADQLLSLVAS